MKADDIVATQNVLLI